MNVLFIGKRFYTNRDALRECYGRIYQLPSHWSRAWSGVKLWLVDYHTSETIHERDGNLKIVSTPVRNMALFGQCWKERTSLGKKYDMVVASGDCYIGLMAYHIARRHGAEFVFDVYDKYDEFGAYRKLPGFDPFQFLLKRADTSLFASRGLMQDLSSLARRSVLVPNGVDRVRFSPRDMQTSKQLLGLPDNILFVGYFGGMEPDRGVSDLIDAVQILRATGMNIELLLGGKDSSGMCAGRDGVRYLGNVPFDQVPLALASCDLLAVPYRRSAVMDAGASNKIAEAIACQRPLVATRTPNLVSNFPTQAERLDSLLAIPGDAADLARVIREQSKHRILVNMPTGMGWDEIALHTADCLSLATETEKAVT